MNVKLRCYQSTRKLQSWFSIKDRQALLNRFNIVYKLTCSCGASYIGQTQRNLINRIEENRTSLSSSVCRHSQANQDHRVDFHYPEVTGSDKNWRRLQSLDLHWFKNTKQSWMQTSRRCLYAFLTCNRASCLAHDIAPHHRRFSLAVIFIINETQWPTSKYKNTCFCFV